MIKFKFEVSEGISIELITSMAKTRKIDFVSSKRKLKSKYLNFVGCIYINTFSK